MTRFSLLTACFLMMSAAFSYAYANRVDFIVPVRAIYPGQVVSNAGLGNKNFYIKADAVSLYVTNIEQVMNKVARHTLIAGRPIALSALGNPVLVSRGQTAKLVYSSGDLRITAIGVALQPGSSGDFIKVRNVDSGRVITGTVLEDGSVQVGIQ